MKKSILTIDGSNSISYLINTVLGEEFSVTSVNTCKDAINYLQIDHNKDLIILDIADVKSENIDLLEHFYTSSIFKNIKTVVISNSDDATLREKTVELGASLFFTKPFDPIQLSQMLKEILSENEFSVVKKRKNRLNMNIF